MPLTTKLDTELDQLLATLSSIIDSVGLPPDRTGAAGAASDPAAAFAQDEFMATRLKLVRRAEAVAALVDLGYDALQRSEKSTEAIRRQAEIRRGLAEGRELWARLDQLYAAEVGG